jgi:hypothetical protein
MKGLGSAPSPDQVRGRRFDKLRMRSISKPHGELHPELVEGRTMRLAFMTFAAARAL